MFPYFSKYISIVLCLGLMLGFVPHYPVSAVDPLVFNVNTTDDGPDFATNSVCSVGQITGGPCTLRAALSEAYWHLGSRDVIINLDSDTYLLTIPPDTANTIDTGDLDIPGTDPPFLHTIEIVTNDPENRAVIDGNQLDRVFRIGSGVNLNLENLIVRGGLLLVSTETYEGAGIFNHGVLNLNNVIIEDNEARCNLDPCSVTVSGGAILNYGSIIMSESTIQNNISELASAIFNAGRFVILNSTIANNHAKNLLTIINYSNMHIRNSTISNNTAENTEFHYVGITNHEGSYLVVESSTIANAGQFAGILNHGDVTIKDSILAALPAQIASNCLNNGAWTSEGYNIFSDDTCPATGTGDLPNTNPLLGFLGFWGGPTMTIALRPGSPAINHRPGDCETISFSPLIPSETLTIDQRFFERNDGQCDTGAFEGSVEITNIFLPLISK